MPRGTRVSKERKRVAVARQLVAGANPHEQGLYKTTGCFVRGRFVDLSAIPNDVLRGEWQRRMVLRRATRRPGTGRPAVLRTCPDCHAQMSAREFHRHSCEQRHQRRRAAVVAERTQRYLAWSRDLARQAARHLPPSVDLDDLQQIASMALMRCAAEYNDKPAEGYTRPTPFRVYAWRKVYFACLMVSLGRMPVIPECIAGELDQAHVGTREVLQFLVSKDGKGALQIWKRPVEGKNYVIGIDTAVGTDIGAKSGKSDPDYSVACVIDQDTGEQVALLRGRIEPSPFGEYVAALGRFYNWAFLVPEINFGSGIALIEQLLRSQYPVHLIYQRQRPADDRRAPTLKELGWETTTVTTPQLISVLDRAIREMAVILHDPLTISELRTFVYKSNGKMEGQEGCHDDCVIAHADGGVQRSSQYGSRRYR